MAQKYIRGIEIIITANVGTTEKPEWKPLAGQRKCTINRSGDTIDVSNKVTSGWKESLTGLKEWSIDTDGIFVEDDKALAILEDCFIESKVVKIKMSREDDSWGYEGEAIITDFPLEASYDDAVTYSMTLKGAGGLEKVKFTSPEEKELKGEK